MLNIADLLSTNSWVWVDYMIAGMILISVLFGLIRGFVKEIFALLTMIGAVWVGSQYGQDFSFLFQNIISSVSFCNTIGFIIMFVVTLMLGYVIRLLLWDQLNNNDLTITERLLGMSFGLIRGIVMILIVVMPTDFTQIAQDQWWKHSRLLPPFQSLAVWLKDRIPFNLSDYIKFH